MFLFFVLTHKIKTIAVKVVWYDGCWALCDSWSCVGLWAWLAGWLASYPWRSLCDRVSPCGSSQLWKHCQNTVTVCCFGYSPSLLPLFFPIWPAPHLAMVFYDILIGWFAYLYQQLMYRTWVQWNLFICVLCSRKYSSLHIYGSPSLIVHTRHFMSGEVGICIELIECHF